MIDDLKKKKIVIWNHAIWKKNWWQEFQQKVCFGEVGYVIFKLYEKSRKAI